MESAKQIRFRVAQLILQLCVQLVVQLELHFVWLKGSCNYIWRLMVQLKKGDSVFDGALWANSAYHRTCDLPLTVPLQVSSLWLTWSCTQTSNKKHFIQSMGISDQLNFRLWSTALRDLIFLFSINKCK